MKRCGELVLSCGALEIVAALGIRSAVSGRDSHRAPKNWYGTQWPRWESRVRIGRDGFEIRTPLRVRRHVMLFDPDPLARVLAGIGGSSAPLNIPPWPASNFVLGGHRAYARDDSTPGWEALEEIVGGLEGGSAIAFASGMAGIAAVFEQLPAGAKVALPDDCYHGVAGTRERGAAERGVERTSNRRGGHGSLDSGVRRFRPYLVGVTVQPAAGRGGVGRDLRGAA
jgi:hypothetical protein